MITASDLYHVLTAVVPLYVAMILAYGSVKWWKIFSPDQCSGINRFVALFAVPLLSFHFISTNDPYAMNYRFIAADTLQKLIILACSPITLFSLSTLPNTLVMGIPLLKGMYGAATGTLMVQIVVLQCIIWYTLMLFLFEYRGARLLIAEQFPDTAGSIISFRVDSDVISLDGKEPLQTEAEIGDDGKLRVTVRKSSASRSDVFSRHSHGPAAAAAMTPRRRTSATRRSTRSSRPGTPRRGPEHAWSEPTELQLRQHGLRRGDRGGKLLRPNGAAVGARRKGNGGGGDGGKELHMFVWSSSASPVSEVGGQLSRGAELGNDDHCNGERVALFPGALALQREKDECNNLAKPAAAVGASSTPPASVMTRLILIMVWRKLIRNPNTYSSLIGLIWSLVSFRWGIEMPAIIARSISILSDAGLGMAMFSLGLFHGAAAPHHRLRELRRGLCHGREVRHGPAVMAAASIAVGLRGVLLHIAIVQAALPQGIVPFVFAKEYNVHPDILSTGSVIFGMLIALPITLVYYILLGL
ncbi:unnamed protein product [Spirodela intermedia]|uniref:Auxin efflux carrier component n=1 Tax=Spirodela intermedia TaxID=51605 RepID=A0A7I8IC02_SPIIN|nr:unnamed protein product [Spirodela intermedia]CAA6654411.1 unnamed protein product [Spirodela intermedia]